MHGSVDPPCAERSLQGRGEHAAAADLRQRRVLVDIALRGDDLDRGVEPRVGGEEESGDVPRLMQGQFAAARTDGEPPEVRPRCGREMGICGNGFDLD
jgi:hypothetical protein